ncbi:DUF642 domain-containing protein [Pseudoalteromonas fenneropenaei]|uniref:DUF642 domain-containing protein n=1 Tax=Pseudoalteromonas fenneropenaei TaxID=1737459 RepID=A0ABV7CLG3_9GAMM
MKFSLLSITLATLVTATPSLAANLVANGSFEQTPSFSSTWTLFDTLSGWQREGAKFEIQKTSLGIIAAQDGNQYLELDSTANYTAKQTIATTAGKSYVLTFYYSARVVNNTNTNRASVTWNGTEVIALNATTRGWQKVELQVTATSADSELAFKGMGTSDSYGALIDNVALVEKVSRPNCTTGLFAINNFGDPVEGYVYHLDPATGESTMLANLTNTASNIAAANGNLFFMEQTNSSNRDSTIWRYDLRTSSQSQVVATNSYPIYRSAVRDDGQALRATSQTYMYDFDLQTGAKTVLGKLSYAGDSFEHGDIAYSADGNVLYVLTGQALYTLATGSMELTKIGEHGINWASGLAITDSGEMYVSGRNSGENAKLYQLNPQTAEATFVMEGPRHINDLTFSGEQCL